MVNLLVGFAMALGLVQSHREPPRLVPQLGHSGPVTSVAFSPDGRTLASGSGATVKIWDATTGKQVRTLSGHELEVKSVAFSPDGRTVASGSWDGTIKLWDVPTGNEVRKLTHDIWVNHIAFSPNGRAIASGGLGKTIKIWDVATGTVLQTLDWHEGRVSSIAYSPDGRILASGRSDCTIQLWNVSTGKGNLTLKGHADIVSSVAFSTDGRTIASGSHDKTIKLWDATTGDVLRTLSGHTGPVSSVAFSPDGRTLASVSGDKTIKLWDANTGEVVRTLSGHTGPVSSVAFSPNGRTVASVESSRIKLWNVANGRENLDLRMHTSSVVSVALSSKGRSLASASWYGTIKFWNPATGREVGRVAGHTNVITTLAYSPDGRYLASGSRDETIKLWDVATMKKIRVLIGHTSWINSVAFTPSGRYLASGSQDNSIKLWDVATGEQIRTLIGHASWISSVAFSPDGHHLASGSFDKSIKLWDVATGKELRSLIGHTSEITTLAYSPDGRYLASGSEDKTIKLWDAATGKVLRTLIGHANWINSIAYSPDGRTIASGSFDQSIKLWDVATGKETLQLPNPRSNVTEVAFSSDGRVLVSGAYDATVRLWDVSTGKELCSLISFDDGTWAVIAPDGRYDASNGGDVDGVIWVIDNQPVDLAQLKDEYYEPGLLSKLMGFNKDPLRNVTPLDKLDVQLPPEASVKPIASGFEVTLTDRGGGIGDTDLYVNGGFVRTAPRPAGSPKTYSFTVRADEPGVASRLLPKSALVKDQENILRVVGHTYDTKARPTNPQYFASRAVSVPVPARLDQQFADKPTLHILAIGSSDYAGNALDLRYAAKDATDFASTMQKAAELWLGKENVKVHLLTSDPEQPNQKPATRAQIEAAFHQVAAEAKSTDIVLVFFAGHGVGAGGEKKDYFYLPADLSSGSSDTQAFRDYAISGRQIADWLTSISAAKQAVILDTCASGEFAMGRDGGADIRRSWERLKDRSGVFMLAGCAGDRVSYESSRYNQGLLTYSLLKAIKTDKTVLRQDAAAGKDPFLDIVALMRSAEDEVPKLAEGIKGIQKPEFRSGPEARTFDVGQLSDALRSSIPLASPLPVLLEPGNVRDEDSPSDSDTLALRDKLRDGMRNRSSRGRGDGFAFWETQRQPGAFSFNVKYKRNGLQWTATAVLVGFVEEAGLIKEQVVGIPIVVTAAAEALDRAILDAVIRAASERPATPAKSAA